MIDAVNNLFLEIAKTIGKDESKCLIIYYYTVEDQDACVNGSHPDLANIKFYAHDLRQLKLAEDLQAIQDLINICNSMTKDIWKLDKRKAEEINIDEFFELNSRDHELIEATVYYKPKRELNDQFILVLATKNQKDLAWKYGIRNLTYGWNIWYIK
ncbi:hypothetical protein C1646_765672 [Rhizophagus diaphanus]|nr:hypothetical protein C1646_765672 [Rhizophagus diaphanus] [Rhizophagus sp. MUCL 43196]